MVAHAELVQQLAPARTFFFLSRAVRISASQEHLTVGVPPQYRVDGEMVSADKPPLTFEMNTALRRAGFDMVFDTNFTADLTIIEEGTELIQRLDRPEGPPGGPPGGRRPPP